MYERLWQRWHKEYLYEIQLRSKWSQRQNPVRLNDIVLIKEDKLPPSKWLLMTSQNGGLRFFTRHSIFDGDDEESMLIGRWCTQNKPEDIISSSNKMLIKYKISVAYLSHNIGFVAKFREGCGGTFINSSGSFTSPRYPQNYLSDRTCTYKIQAPVGQVISLNMEDFRLRFNHSCDGSSYSDNVAYYSPAQEERFKVAHYCKSPPGTFISKYNTLIIVFYSNLLEPKEKGFNASYSFLPIGCGGVLTDPVGKIKFEQELDVNYKFCEWVIFAPVGNFILLRFSSFMLEDLNKECLVQKLSIYTNNTDPARLTGSYCGQVSPPSSTYISNIVTIILEHKALMSTALIEADYEFIKESTACGGNYMGNSGQLKSPNWPSDYPNSLNCEWIINVDFGQQIELNVKNFKIENGECLYDFLVIRNGGSRDSPLIGKFCGENIPKKIPSASNKLYINFETDWSVSYEGFLIEWNAVSTSCGGILNAYKGTIISPHYPNLVSQVAQCDWSIIVSEGSVIDITVTIVPEYLDNCYTEFLKIYDGSSSADNRLKMNCSDIGAKIRTSTNKAFIRYDTTSGGSSGAFILFYDIWCQNTITNIVGTIESPNFPDPYPNNIDCEWSIKTKGSNRISIAFSHVDLEKTDARCIYDMLTLKEETNETYICEKPEKIIKSEGNTILVKFKTDSSRSEGGFRLEYRIEGCGGYLKEDFGYIESPNFPFSVNVFCNWVIEADYGQVIQFTITDLHLEGNNSTNGFILSNDQKEEHTILNVRHTAEAYQEVVSSGRMLYVRFFTDEIRQKKYFKAHYSILSSSCGGRISSKEGDLYSPNFPRTQGTFYCEWTLSASQQYTLDLTFKYFDLDCTNSYFEIYSGYAKNPNGLIINHCGDTIPTIPTNISEISYLLVFNATNTMRENNGFILHHSRNCGREFIDQSQAFFDKKQSENGCIWIIKATNKTTHITLHFTSLECSCEGLPIEECESQKGISVHEGDSVNAPLIKNICKAHPPSIVSNGQALTVVGKTGSFSAKFSLYDNDCGHFIQSPSGKFTSPQYPNSYPVNIECEWTIQAEAGNYIVISFDAMDIWSSPFCNEDYLEIRQEDSTGKLFGTFCGSEIPRNLKIYKSVWIKFRSDGDNVADGFMLSWKYAHHSILSGSGGEIKSPPIHSVENDDVDYMWIIEVPDDNVISLVFTDYHEGLRIYDGFDSRAKEIPLYPTTPNVLSSSSAVTLISENRILKEFSIEWKASLRNSLITNATGNCPKGVLILSANNTKNISSPGYPNAYDSNLDCEWVLKPLESIHHVVLHVYEARLESMPNCDADYLQVSISDDLINWLPENKLCSQLAEMKPFKTYHGRPYLKINFKTDFSVNEIGFTSLARTSCGNTLTDSEVIIKSDDIYFDPDEAISICVWNIKVNPGKRIKFDILDMNFPSAVNDYSNCQTYLSIRDGIDKYSAFLGESSKYCSRDPPILPQTTSNRAVVEFHFKDTTNFHWQLKYTEVSDECIFNIRLDSDTNLTIISTPEMIAPYLQCVWIIMAPPDHSLVMIFNGNFDLAQSFPCTLEYIEVKDGLTELSPLIGKFCFRPNDIHSTGKGFYLRYSTNTPEPNPGFQATIKVAKCGGTYNYRQSEIRSTNYPALGGYPSGTVCNYRIKLFEYQGINLTLSDINLPIHSDMNESDRLTIFSIEEADNNKEVLIHICTIYGNNTLNNVIIYTHMALIKFSTYRPNNAYRGFRIKYEAFYEICGGEIFDESGKITIQKDNPTRFCSWSVTVPKGQRITLEVLNLEESLEAEGDFNIEIFNDETRYSKIAFDHKNTKVVQSSDNRIYIQIDREFDSKLKGFEARFTSDEPSFCPHDIVDNFGTILFADNNETFYCETEFSLNSRQTLVLTIKQLSIFNVVNGSISPFAIHGEYFSERLLFYESIDKKVVPISTKVGKLVLLQKELKMLSGFEIEYKKLECGGVILLDGAVSISKPNITGINGSIDCAWRVRSEYSINYNFVGTFNLNNDCESEYFIMHESFMTFDEGKKICGNDSFEFIIYYNGAYLVYHANAYNINSSFEIVMRPKLNCGGQITEHEYLLQYINFLSSDYRNNLQCVWDIKVQSGKSIEISFAGRFFIEESKNCTKDYLEIRKKVFGEWVSLPKLCGRHIPDTMLITESNTQIIFRSDDTITADGFSIYLRAVCGGVYSVTTEKREISSPMSFYETDLTCNYTLISQNYDLININFISLNLDTDVNCATGRLKVYKEYDDEMVEFGKYCTFSSTRTIKSRHRIELIFEGFVGIVESEYRFNFYLDTCGGDIRNSTTIKTPKDESGIKYPSDMICIWNITAPQNHSITIEFKEFDMHSSLECMYDYVRIYEGNNTEPENEKAHFCGNLTGHYPTVKISNSKAIVSAQSDHSLSGSGFLASIKFSKNCDQRIYLTNSSIGLDKLVMPGDGELDCYFDISTQPSYNIRVQFRSLQFSNCQHECGCDYLEVREGQKANSQLIEKFCNSSVPTTSFFFHEKFLLRLVSDGVGSNVGFSADLHLESSECGLSDINLWHTEIKSSIEKKDTNMRYSIKPRIRLAITLRFIASGDSYRSLEFFTRISRRTISRFIPEALSAIYAALQPHYLKLSQIPEKRSEWLEVARDFQYIWHFPHTLGALDGKHIRILAPAHSGSTFYNYKGFFSIVLFALVDAHSAFLYIN